MQGSTVLSMLAISNLGAGCSGAALPLAVIGLAAGAVGPELSVLALPAFLVDFKSGFCGVGWGDWPSATATVISSIPMKDNTWCNRYLRIRNSLLSQNMPLYKTDWNKRRWHSPVDWTMFPLLPSIVGLSFYRSNAI